MNNTVNTFNTDQAKTSLPALKSSASTMFPQRNAATTGDSSGYTKSFQDALNKAIDFSSLADLEGNEDVNGNILPALDNSSELSAQADRSTLAASVDAVSESEEHVINLQDSILVNPADVETAKITSLMIKSSSSSGNTVTGDNTALSATTIATSSSTLLSKEMAEPITAALKGQALTDTESQLQAQVLPLQSERTGQTVTKEVTNTGVSPSTQIHSLINKTAIDENNPNRPVFANSESAESETVKKETLESSTILLSNKRSAIDTPELHKPSAYRPAVQSASNQMQDNLPLSATGIAVDDISSDELNRLTTAVSSSNSVDENTKLGFNVNLPSYLRPLLDSRPASAKVTQVGLTNYTLKATTNTIASNTVTSNIVTSNTVIDSSMIQSPEVLNMSAEYNMLAEKNLTLAYLTNQQQLSSALQTSPLLQTAIANPQLDGLTVISNTSVNNLTSITTPALSQGVISEAFGRATWSQGMGKQILNMVNQNIGTAEIRLNPAHLGPIEIMIDMSEDQVNVSLSSRHAIVREAMEQALPRLREMLDENGFNLADTDISKHSFAEQRQQNENNKPDILNNINENINTSDITDSVIKQVSIETGSVDYYV